MWLLALRNTAEMRLLVIIKDTLQLDRKAGEGWGGGGGGGITNTCVKTNQIT